jgi:meiotically up-regulated gene 157 (Mug157) protein
MAAPRRSTRIRNIDLGVTAESDKPATVPAPAGTSKKRKVSIEDVQEKATEPKRQATAKTKKVPAKGKGKTETETKTNGAATKPSADIAIHHNQVPDDALSVLPAEILETILENVSMRNH